VLQYKVRSFIDHPADNIRHNQHRVQQTGRTKGMTKPKGRVKGRIKGRIISKYGTSLAVKLNLKYRNITFNFKTSITNI